MGAKSRDCIFLERHACGHYTVLHGTPKLAGGSYMHSVRVSDTDGYCPLCITRVRVKAGLETTQAESAMVRHD